MNNQNQLHIAIIYLAVINVVTFFMYGIDKRKAKKSKWRISEAALFMMAVLGGSIGAWLGMKVWHHKTLHKKFRYGIPLILIVQIVLVLLILCSQKQAAAATHHYQIKDIPIPALKALTFSSRFTFNNVATDILR